MALNNHKKIAVLFGGSSAEREVSLQSGQAVYESLKRQGYNVVSIDAEGDQLKKELIDQQIDCCVIMFHGQYGEGGQAQQLLDSLNIPYTGSNALSSATGMDKLQCKSIWHKAGFLTSKAKKMQHAKDIGNLNFPLAVKPVSDGSSIGVHKVFSQAELLSAYKDAKQYGEVMAEEWIDGKELTVSIVNNQTLPIIWIKSQNGFYDYQAKYISDLTEYICPVNLSKELTRNIQETALKAFNLIGCHGWGRVDFILRNNAFFLLELNTIPGMTNHSLVPKAAHNHGWNFDQLVVKILETAKG